MKHRFFAMAVVVLIAAYAVGGVLVMLAATWVLLTTLTPRRPAPVQHDRGVTPVRRLGNGRTELSGRRG